MHRPTFIRSKKSEGLSRYDNRSRIFTCQLSPARNDSKFLDISEPAIIRNYNHTIVTSGICTRPTTGTEYTRSKLMPRSNLQPKEREMVLVTASKSDSEESFSIKMDKTLKLALSDSNSVVGGRLTASQHASQKRSAPKQSIITDFSLGRMQPLNTVSSKQFNIKPSIPSRHKTDFE